MANEKILNTRIQLKYDSFANWTTANTPLKVGELAIAYLGETQTTTSPDNGTHPVLFKVGPGNFNDLPWASALAADVYAWAKKNEVKIEGDGNAVTAAAIKDGFLTFTKGETFATVDQLEEIVGGLDADTNTKYHFEVPTEGANAHKLVITKKDITDADFVAYEVVDILTASELGDIISNFNTELGKKLDANGWIANSNEDGWYKAETSAKITHSEIALDDDNDGWLTLKPGSLTMETSAGPDFINITTTHITHAHDGDDVDYVMSFPNASGTIALTDDIPDVSNKLDANGWVNNKDNSGWEYATPSQYGNDFVTSKINPTCIHIENGGYDSTTITPGAVRVYDEAGIGSATFNPYNISISRIVSDNPDEEIYSYHFPHKSGTLAITDEIPDVSNKLDANGWTSENGELSFEIDAPQDEWTPGTKSINIDVNGIDIRHEIMVDESDHGNSISLGANGISVHNNESSAYIQVGSGMADEYIKIHHYNDSDTYYRQDKITIDDKDIVFPEKAGTFALTSDVDTAKGEAKSYIDTELSDFNTETVAPLAERVKAIEDAPYATEAQVNGKLDSEKWENRAGDLIKLDSYSMGDEVCTFDLIKIGNGAAGGEVYVRPYADGPATKLTVDGLLIEEFANYGTTYERSRIKYNDNYINLPEKEGTFALTTDTVAKAEIASQLENSLTVGSKSFNGSAAVEITAADLGLSGAMHFIGAEETLPTTANDGDVVLIGGKEYVWANAKWNELGDESSHALKSIKITGTGYLTGGGDLTTNRTIDLTQATKDKIDGALPANGWRSSGGSLVYGDDPDMGEGIAISTSQLKGGNPDDCYSLMPGKLILAKRIDGGNQNIHFGIDSINRFKGGTDHYRSYTYNFPEKDGTFALTSEIPDISNKLDANGWENTDGTLWTESGAISLSDVGDYCTEIDKEHIALTGGGGSYGVDITQDGITITSMQDGRLVLSGQNIQYTLDGTEQYTYDLPAVSGTLLTNNAKISADQFKATAPNLTTETEEVWVFNCGSSTFLVD